MAINEKAVRVATLAAQTTVFDGNVIAEIPKNTREVCRVIRRIFKGYILVDIRVRFDSHSSGDLRPGKGVAIKREALPAIITALAGLLDGGRR